MPVRKRVSKGAPVTLIKADPRDRVTPGGGAHAKSTFNAIPLKDREIKGFFHVAGSPHPKEMFPVDLLASVQVCDSNTNIEKTYRNRIKSPLTGIRAFCILCQGGPKAVKGCSKVVCPLWPFRLGSNSFYGRKS